MPSRKHTAALLLLCLATAFQMLAGTVQDAMKCAVVPNANVKIFLERRMVKDLYQAGRNFAAIILANAPDYEKEDIAQFQAALAFTDMLGIQDIQLSAALDKAASPVPAVCLAISTTTPVPLQAIQTLIQQFDKQKRLQLTPLDATSFMLLGGMVHVKTAADGNLLLVMSAPAAHAVTANIQNNTPYHFPEEHVRGLREDGFCHLVLNNINVFQQFLKDVPWKGPWPVSMTFCEYIDGDEQFLTTRIHCASPEDAQNLKQQLNAVLNGKAFLPGMLPDVSGCDLILTSTVPVKRSVLTGGCSAFVPFAAAMLLPALSKAREKARSISCVSNLKQISLALIMYAYDHDDMYAPAENVFTQFKDYLGDDNFVKVTTCPSCGKQYIYHGKASKMSSVKYPSKTITFTCPTSHNGQFAVAFADGHVESIRAASLQQLLQDHPEFLLLKDVK